MSRQIRSTFLFSWNNTLISYFCTTFIFCVVIGRKTASMRPRFFQSNKGRAAYNSQRHSLIIHFPQAVKVCSSIFILMGVLLAGHGGLRINLLQMIMDWVLWGGSWRHSVAIDFGRHSYPIVNVSHFIPYFLISFHHNEAQMSITYYFYYLQSFIKYQNSLHLRWIRW